MWSSVNSEPVSFEKISTFTNNVTFLSYLDCFKKSIYNYVCMLEKQSTNCCRMFLGLNNIIIQILELQFIASS